MHTNRLHTERSNRFEINMKISAQQLKSSIQRKLDTDLPLRVYTLMEEVIAEELTEIEEVELFHLLVKLIMRADRIPASIISNLLIPIDSEKSCHLDDTTILEAASFLRDYIKKDCLLQTLQRMKS